MCIRDRPNRHVPTVFFTWTGGSKYRYKIDDGSWVQWVYTTSGRAGISANWGEKVTIEVHEDIEGGTVSKDAEFTLPLFAPPTGLALIKDPDDYTKAILSWDDPDYEDITGYRIYKTVYTKVRATGVITVGTTTETNVTGHSTKISKAGSNPTHIKWLEIKIAATSSDGVGLKSELLHHGGVENLKVYRQINGIKIVFDEVPNKTQTYRWKKNVTNSNFASLNPTLEDGKYSKLLETEDTDTNATYTIKASGGWTEWIEVSSIPITDTNSAEEDLVVYLEDIDEQQRDYFEKHGRFFQKLESTVPTDDSSTIPDHTDPDDQEFTGDSDHDFDKKVPFSVKIDEWLTEDTAYYKVTVKLSHDRVYTKSAEKKVTMGADGNTHSDFTHSNWR